MKRQQVLDKLDKAWAALQESYAGLAGDRLEAPGEIGGWSVKDVLAHVTTWEEEAVKYLPWILEGRRPPRYADQYGGVDAFNHQMWEKKRHLPLDEVLAQMEQSHRRLLDYVRRSPEEQFATETRFRRRLRLDTYSHYPEHTKAILAWRERSR